MWNCEEIVSLKILKFVGLVNGWYATQSLSMHKLKPSLYKL